MKRMFGVMLMALVLLSVCGVSMAQSSAPVQFPQNGPSGYMGPVCGSVPCPSQVSNTSGGTSVTVDPYAFLGSGSNIGTILAIAIVVGVFGAYLLFP